MSKGGRFWLTWSVLVLFGTYPTILIHTWLDIPLMLALLLYFLACAVLARFLGSFGHGDEQR